MKNPNENQVKDKIRIQQSEYNPVPLYRSYGVTSKERPVWTKIKIFLQKALATFVLGVPMLVVLVGAYILIVAGGLLISTAIVSALSVFAFFKLSKSPRKRMKFISSVKKLCRSNGYKYGYKAEILTNPIWLKSGGSPHAVLHTNSRVYHIRFLSVKKYRSKLRFESESRATLVKPPLRNSFSVIYDLKTKKKSIDIDFSQITRVPGKENIMALVICPTCEEWSYKFSESSYVPTGNAETVFGYNVYTSSGFINDVRRFEEE